MRVCFRGDVLKRTGRIWRGSLCLLFLTLLIPFGFLGVEAQEIQFTHLSRNEGLSHSIVYSIVQDKKGFLWFGTIDGLNKYDGYSLLTYQYDPYNPESIPTSDAANLLMDQDGSLWIGAWGKGLIRFDLQKERFEQYMNDPENPNSLSDNRVQSLYQDRVGKIFTFSP